MPVNYWSMPADANSCAPAKDPQICQQLGTSASTVVRVRQRFVRGGLDVALLHKPQQKRKDMRARQCLSERMNNKEQLRAQVALWQQRRNQAQVKVNWRFTTAEARIKLKKLYPSILP